MSALVYARDSALRWFVSTHLWFYQGEPGLAVPAFSRLTLARAPGCPRQRYQKLGKLDEAREGFERSLQLDFEQPAIKARLAHYDSDLGAR